MGVRFFDILDPPPPPPSQPQKSGFQVGGGLGGGSGPKIYGGMRLLDKIMILQGVRQTIQPLEVGAAKRPKRGGMWRFPLYTGLQLSSNNLCEVIDSTILATITSPCAYLPLPPPPWSLPTPSCSPGGGGHLVNPKFFVAAHCVVVWVTVLWGIATCVPCTHGRTFCSLSLKWNLTTQPCFPLGQM